MVKGLNSDLIIRGRKFHVQTEDWGRENPFLVTKVFCDGAVLRTIKTPYTALTKTSLISKETLQMALAEQHQKVLNLLHETKL